MEVAHGDYKLKKKRKRQDEKGKAKTLMDAKRARLMNEREGSEDRW